MASYTLNKNKIKNYKLKPEEFYSKEDIEYYKNKKIDLIFPSNENETNLKYKLSGVYNYFENQKFDSLFKNSIFKFRIITDEDKGTIIGKGEYVFFYKRFD